ncbi:MAG: hypothetical protein WBE22_10940 [Halobacteriota archaeon]
MLKNKIIGIDKRRGFAVYLSEEREKRCNYGYSNIRSLILEGVSDELRAVKFFPKTHLGPKYLMAAYKELSYGEGFIITAYKTTKIDKIVKMGVIWKK